MIRQPMLAAKFDGNLKSLRFPLVASPKVDGIRAVNFAGTLFSRTMKPIPNLHVQQTFGQMALEGLDGELICGDPAGKSVFRDTTSAVMSIGGRPDVQYHVFDHFIATGEWRNRFKSVELQAAGHPHVRILPQTLVEHGDDILQLEADYLALGYEGLILRDPRGLYKAGRSTLSEGYLIKLKRFSHSEAEIMETIELCRNANEAKPDERGYMKRSSHQENKVPAGVLGALSVRDMATGVTFEIGTGFCDTDRETLWAQRDKLRGLIVRYKFFATGSKDKPRFPIFDGFRDRRDL
jgi:DNA ligase-1